MLPALPTLLSCFLFFQHLAPIREGTVAPVGIPRVSGQVFPPSSASLQYTVGVLLNIELDTFAQGRAHRP